MAKRILFVCLGNICRSPLAEGLMLRLVRENGLDVFVDSAGTANYHVGEAPDARTVKNAKKHGFDLSVLRARQFDIKDFDQFDMIFVMDKNNYRDLMRLAEGKQQAEKVHLFLEFTGNTSEHEMPDPYYGAEAHFENVFQLTLKACENLCELIKSHRI